jgi:two-component system, response regulator
MSKSEETKTILIAEDDEDHFLLIHEALVAAEIEANISQVKDGIALLNFLLHRGEYQDQMRYRRPDLILLDLNLPKKDGRWALKEIKTHTQLKTIPVIALTTTQQEEDIVFCYREGINAFIRKPASFKDLVHAMKSVGDFWLKVAQLPNSQA